MTFATYFNPGVSLQGGAGSSSSTSPGGSDTQVQFNDGGVFGGSSGLTFNKSTGRLTVGSSGQLFIGATGTAAAPSLVLSGTDTGFFSAAAGVVGFGSAGNESFRLEGVLGFGLRSAGLLWWTSSSIGAYSQRDLVLARDAANVLALRNGTNAQESRVYGSYTNATNFQRMSIKTLRESSGALSGASYTTTIAIPAYVNLIGVTTRVTTAVTGATTYDVGDGSDVNLWGAAIDIALGAQSRTADFTAVGAVGAAATSRTVTLTANGSNFTGGVIEICLHYLTTEAD